MIISKNTKIRCFENPIIKDEKFLTIIVDKDYIGKLVFQENYNIEYFKNSNIYEFLKTLNKKIIFVSNIEIFRPYRLNGYGSYLIQYFIENYLQDSNEIILQMSSEFKKYIISFIKKFGFKQIENSLYFIYQK